MHPLLIKIGPIPIHTYGVLIAIGFLAGIFTARKLAARSGLNVDRFLDFSFWALLIGLIGARALFVITRIESFLLDPVSIFKVWEGGLVFFGGLLAVVPFAWWYFKKYKLPFWKTADVALPGLVIGHFFGRLGCLAAGCCYGKPTGSSFGIRLYSDLVESAYHGITLHPTQLYEAGALLVLFVGMMSVFKRKKFDGQVALTYFLIYPVIRSVIEVFRGDLIRGFVIDNVVSTSQFISALVFVAALVILVVRSRQLSEENSSNNRRSKPKKRDNT
ncbi:MAG: prolipoprotein diacylglyceryl transferase [Bdellovibrionota bacterium]